MRLIFAHTGPMHQYVWIVGTEGSGAGGGVHIAFRTASMSVWSQISFASRMASVSMVRRYAFSVLVFCLFKVLRN